MSFVTSRGFVDSLEIVDAYFRSFVAHCLEGLRT